MMRESKSIKPDAEKGAKRREGAQILVGTIVGVLVGTLLGVGAAFYSQGAKIATLEAQIENLKRELESKSTSSPQPTATNESKSDPNHLIDIIKAQQRKYVRESSGPFAYQSFTEDDLKAFRASNIRNTIVSDLKHDNEFIAVVLKIKEMDPTERQALLTKSSQTFHPTWAELHKISPDGQTEAGQAAEREIATIIVNLVRDLTKLTPDQINELYT
jgi:hypothetical protein